MERDHRGLVAARALYLLPPAIVTDRELKIPTGPQLNLTVS